MRRQNENQHFSLFFWQIKRNKGRKWHKKQQSYLNVFIVLQFLRLTPRACAPTSVSLLYFTLWNRKQNRSKFACESNKKNNNTFWIHFFIMSSVVSRKKKQINLIRRKSTKPKNQEEFVDELRYASSSGIHTHSLRLWLHLLKGALIYKHLWCH